VTTKRLQILNNSASGFTFSLPNTQSHAERPKCSCLPSMLILLASAQTTYHQLAKIVDSFHPVCNDISCLLFLRSLGSEVGVHRNRYIMRRQLMETTFGLQLRGILLNDSFLVLKSGRTKRFPFQSGNLISGLVPKYR
jgi:hypothetical protein